MSMPRCCGYCVWYRDPLPGLLYGCCANPLVARLDGQYGLQRAGFDSCALWSPKWRVETSGCTVLSDDDLAEADRHARKIREETR